MGFPVLLAIETSQRTGGVALREAAGDVHVEMLRETGRHDDDLMPAIKRLVDKAGLTPRDLEAVGVSIGPGGFTGLRIAVTTTKMLAETLGVKVIGVPSALVVAESHKEDDGPILIALASKRETAWITRMIKSGGAWEIQGEPGLADAASIDFSGVRVLLADRYLPDSIRETSSHAGLIIEEPFFDPAACLELACRLQLSGQYANPLTLTPLYPRPPEAVSLWEERRKPS